MSTYYNFWHYCFCIDSVVCNDHIFRGEGGIGDTLQSCGISDGSTVYFSLSSFSEEIPGHQAFFSDDVVPSVQQSKKGISVFLASLYIIVSSFLWYIVKFMMINSVSGLKLSCSSNVLWKQDVDRLKAYLCFVAWHI